MYRVEISGIEKVNTRKTASLERWDGQRKAADAENFNAKDWEIVRCYARVIAGLLMTLVLWHFMRYEYSEFDLEQMLGLREP